MERKGKGKGKAKGKWKRKEVKEQNTRRAMGSRTNSLSIADVCGIPVFPKSIGHNTSYFKILLADDHCQVAVPWCCRRFVLARQKSNTCCALGHLSTDVASAFRLPQSADSGSVVAFSVSKTSSSSCADVSYESFDNNFDNFRSPSRKDLLTCLPIGKEASGDSCKSFRSFMGFCQDQESKWRRRDRAQGKGGKDCSVLIGLTRAFAYVYVLEVQFACRRRELDCRLQPNLCL